MKWVLIQRARQEVTIPLYLKTDPRLCPEHGLVESVVAAVRGVTVYQLCDNHASEPELITQARRRKTALAGTGMPLIINDRLGRFPAGASTADPEKPLPVRQHLGGCWGRLADVGEGGRQSDMAGPANQALSGTDTR